MLLGSDGKEMLGIEAEDVAEMCMETDADVGLEGSAGRVNWVLRWRCGVKGFAREDAANKLGLSVVIAVAFTIQMSSMSLKILVGRKGRSSSESMESSPVAMSELLPSSCCLCCHLVVRVLSAS